MSIVFEALISGFFVTALAVIFYIYITKEE